MSMGTYSDFISAVGQIESGNNYSFVSWPGYLGRYQFGEEALQTVGFYNGDSTAALDFTGSWTATAASYGVTDKASFLASPAAQDAAMGAWMGKIVTDLDTLGLRQYDGHVVNGVDLTTSGLIAGAHLVGVWNLKAYLESGGAVDPVDPNGEPVSDYIHRFNGFDTPFDNSADGSGASAGSTGGSTGSTGGTPATDPSAGASTSGGSSGGTAPEVVAPHPDPASGGLVLSGSNSLIGGDGADSLTGGEGANYLRGGAGDDQITGGGGFDDINGNQGNDTVHGGAGADWVLGGQGSDLLYGDDGNDLVYGNLGNDTLQGGPGDDTLRGGQGDDVLLGGQGNDWLSGDRGHDTLTGGAGADTFHHSASGGVSVVTDFNAAEGDRVQIDPGAHYDVTQSGPDTVVDLGGGSQMILQNVQASSLGSGWIFQA